MLKVIISNKQQVEAHANKIHFNLLVRHFAFLSLFIGKLLSSFLLVQWQEKVCAQFTMLCYTMFV